MTKTAQYFNNDFYSKYIFLIITMERQTSYLRKIELKLKLNVWAFDSIIRSIVAFW